MECQSNTWLHVSHFGGNMKVWKGSGRSKIQARGHGLEECESGHTNEIMSRASRALFGCVHTYMWSFFFFFSQILIGRTKMVKSKSWLEHIHTTPYTLLNRISSIRPNRPSLDLTNQRVEDPTATRSGPTAKLLCQTHISWMA